MAFTAFTTLLVLGVEGYASGNIVNVSDNMKDKIWMMSTLFAAVSTIACCIPLFFYTFTEKKQAEAVIRIAKRKSAKLYMNKYLATAEAVIADSNRSDLVNAVNTAKSELDKVFRCRDIEVVMNNLKAEDEDFFASIVVEENNGELPDEDSVETTAEAETTVNDVEESVEAETTVNDVEESAEAETNDDVVDREPSLDCEEVSLDDASPKADDSDKE